VDAVVLRVLELPPVAPPIKVVVGVARIDQDQGAHQRLGLVGTLRHLDRLLDAEDRGRHLLVGRPYGLAAVGRRGALAPRTAAWADNEQRQGRSHSNGEGRACGHLVLQSEFVATGRAPYGSRRSGSVTRTRKVCG